MVPASLLALLPLHPTHYASCAKPLVFHPNQNLFRSWRVDYLFSLSPSLLQLIYSSYFRIQFRRYPQTPHIYSWGWPWLHALIGVMFIPWWYLSDYMYLNLFIWNNFRFTEVAQSSCIYFTQLPLILFLCNHDVLAETKLVQYH